MAIQDVGLTAQQITVSSDIDPVLLADGLELIRQEKSISFRDAFRHHWRAVLWSIALSMGCVMDGYDGSIITAFFAQPAFLERFGKDYTNAAGTTTKIISANWQAAFATIGLPGNLLGLYVVGWSLGRFGAKRTYAAGMLLTFGVVFMFVFLQSLEMLLAAEALIYFCWALFQTLSTGYAVEICPIRLRGLAASFISMAWGSGGFLASGVTRASLGIEGDWSWRMPYALQWVWPVPLFFVALFAPESPYWLVRNNKTEEAKQVLTRIATKGYYDDKNLDGYVAFIKHTQELEASSKGSFMDMFKGTDLRRTEIMTCIWVLQQLAGTTMTSYATTFFKDAGMSTTAAFNLNMVVTGMNIVGCFIEFFIINYVGRRRLLLVGMMSLAVCLLCIGILGSVPANNNTLQGIGAFMVLINLFYHASIGPITYTIAAEIPSSALRAQSIALGRAIYVALGAVVSQLTPRMIQPASWNWGAKTGFFWMGANILCTVWAFFRVPETGGFSFAELEILFGNKVPARKFKQVRIHDEAVAGPTTFEASDGDDEIDEKMAGHVQHVAVTDETKD